MTMPEATVYKHYLMSSRKDQVGPPWEFTAVEAEAITESMREPADSKFWFGIATTDTSHVRRAL
jgi:hypothetical protein